LAALVTAGGALVLGIWNATRVRKLEHLKSELAKEEAAAKAKLDYEYEARRRLYGRFEPALFQLLELGDYALERIVNLTDADVWREFRPAEDEAPGARRPPMIKPNYAAVSTVYGLFAPLMIVRLMSRQLTLVDLSLEPRIELQYFLAGRLYGSFKDDFKLAAIEPIVPYDPLIQGDWRRLRQEEPSKYWWQGLTMGRLEDVLDLLSRPHEDSVRLASFGEFEQSWLDSVEAADERACKTLAVASNALLQFRPDTRPVFWRVLIAQARLYHALIRTKADGFAVPKSNDEWNALLALEHPERFEWKTEIPNASSLSQTLEVTDRYFTQMLEERAGSQLQGDLKRTVIRSPAKD
jgi:hypothetical protein